MEESVGPRVDLSARLVAPGGARSNDGWVLGVDRLGVDLHRKITAHHAAIDATLEHGLSQGLIESTNTKTQLLTRIAFGFHGHEPLIALAMLALGSHFPRLPGLSTANVKSPLVASESPHLGLGSRSGCCSPV